MIRFFRFAAVAAFGFVALAAGGARGAVAIPDGLYEALVKAPDSAGTVTYCASKKHVSKVAAARLAYAVSPVTLTSGVTIYRVDGVEPCDRANENGPLLAFVESASGAFRQVLSTAVTGPKMATFGTDGSLTVNQRGGSEYYGVVTYRFDGSEYAEVGDELFDQGTGKHKQIDVPIHFAYGTMSATLSGSVSLDFPANYLLTARADQTMSVVVHPKSGTGLSLSISEGVPGIGPTWYPKTLTWRGKLPASGTYSVMVDGGDADNPSATYTITVAVE
jgi:hypothetical protein